MSQATSPIVCDGCGRDLTATGNSVDYRMALVVQSIPSWGGAVTDMMIYPPLESGKHFCRKACLARWVEAGMPDAAEADSDA